MERYEDKTELLSIVSSTPKQVYKLLRHNSRKGRNIVTTSKIPKYLYDMDLGFFALTIGIVSIVGSAIPVVVAILLLKE